MAVTAEAEAEAFDPVAVLDSVRDLIYQRAVRYALRRDRPDLIEDLAVGLSCYVKAQVLRGLYDPSKSKITTWIWHVAANFLPREFTRLAYAVVVPIRLDGGADGDPFVAIARRPSYRLYDDSTEIAAPDPGEARGLAPDELARLEAAIDSLPARERGVIRSCFGVGVPQETHAAIAARLGVSRTRVGQIRDRGLALLRGRLAS